MFRNSLQNIARDQRAVSGSRLQRVINLSACVYYSDLWFYNPDSDKCQELLCLVCTCAHHVYTSVHSFLLRVHKVTCLLLRQKPARQNHLQPLPDVLKDVTRIKMVSTLPDVVPLHQESSTIRQESRRSSAIMATAFSSHQLNVGGNKRRYSLSHLCYCNNHEDTDGQAANITYTQHSNGRCCTENSNVMHLKVTAHSSTRDRSKSTHSQTGISYQVPHIEQFNFCGRYNNQKINGNNKNNQRVIFPISQTCHIQPSTFKNVKDGEQVEQNNNQSIHLGQEPRKSESEITRDIVLALRRVGDNMDSRLRFENKKSMLAMMGATKIKDGWFTFMTLGHQRVLGAMVCLSLELLRQLNCL